MKTSARGIEQIKANEQLRLAAYQDSAGVWTIGYGETRGVKKGDVCTPDEASRWLLARLCKIEFDLNSRIKAVLSQSQFDALVDFEYNLGQGSFDNSTLLRLLNAGDYKGAAAEFPKWCHAGDHVLAGLVKRRLEEQAEFEGKAA